MKKIASLLLALILLLSLAACAGKTAPSQPEPASEPETSGGPADAQEPEEPAEEQQPEEQTPEEPEEEPAPETVTVTDDCGRTVEIPGEITRIVPTGGLAQIALFALVPDLFVGLANEWSETAGPYIDSAYLDLPVLGTLYGSADLNLEELAVTDPQLIIDLGEAKKTIVEDMDNMQDQTSIPSIHIEASLATMADAYRKLGVILGREERAEELAAFCEKVYVRTADIAEKAGERPVHRGQRRPERDRQRLLPRGSGRHADGQRRRRGQPGGQGDRQRGDHGADRPVGSRIHPLRAGEHL